MRTRSRVLAEFGVAIASAVAVGIAEVMIPVFLCINRLRYTTYVRTHAHARTYWNADRHGAPAGVCQGRSAWQ